MTCIPARFMRLATVLLTVLLAGCDDPAPPGAVVFPPAVSQFSGEMLTVRGSVEFRANDLVEVRLDDGSGPLIASLDEAADSFEVADYLLPDSNPVNVTLTFSNERSGREITQSLLIDRSVAINRMTDLVVTADEIFVADTRLAGIVSVNPVTGRRSLFSGDGVGTGPLLPVPANLEWDGELLYVIEADSNTILTVDPVSGDRSLISGESTDESRGVGVALSNPRELIVTSDRVLVADAGLDAIIEIDPATGDRQQVFREIAAGNPVILSPRAMVQGVDGTIYIADDIFEAIIGIDLASGAFFVVSNREVGEGPVLRSPRDMLLKDAATLTVLDASSGTIVDIDLISGDRTVAADLETSLDVPVAFAEDGGSLVIADNDRGELFRYNLASAEFEAVSRVEVGGGISFGSPSDVINLSDRWVVTDDAIDGLVAVSKADASRTVLLSNSADLPIVGPASLAVDPVTETIYFTFAQLDLNGVVSLATDGTTQLLASPNDGNGPLMINPDGIGWWGSENRILVYDVFRQRLLSIDPVSQARVTIADEETGEGETLSGITRFAVDDAAGLVFLLDEARSRVLLLDLATGSRSLLQEPFADRSLTDIEWDPNTRELLLLDQREGELLALAIDTGESRTVSGAETGQGEVFDQPTGFFLDAANDLILVTDRTTQALVLVDGRSGNRLLVSK